MNFDFSEKISDASGLGGVGIGTPHHLGGSLEAAGGATALVPPHIMQMVRLSQRMAQETNHQQQHYHQHHPVNLTSFNPHKTAAEAFLHNQYAIASFAQAPIMSTQIATTAPSNPGDYQFMMTSSPSTSSTTSSSGGSSSSPPLPPRSYKPCFVCGDKSSGYHYGVSSCEGCKGFFRRSIQKNAKYVCHREKRCEITKTTRSRCQHCRLHKCLDVGMIRESVRNPHHRKRGKEKKPTPAGAGAGSGNGSAGASWRDQRRAYLNAFEGNHQQLREIFPQMLPRDMESLVSIITAAHVKTCPSLNQIKRFTVSGSDLHMAMSMKQKVDLNMWTLFSERSTKCIEKIVEFAKLIPGFLDFSIHDQITLVKYASMDVLVLRLCSRYDVGDDSMTFSDGLTLNRTQMHNCGFGPITKVVFDFAKRLIPLDMDETEIALLSALCIACSDHLDLEEPERVQDVQDPIIEALRLYSRKRRPNLPLIFPQLVMKLYDLRTISLRGEERCQSLDKEIPDGSMPPLISELLLSKDE